MGFDGEIVVVVVVVVVVVRGVTGREGEWGCCCRSRVDVLGYKLPDRGGRDVID